MPKILNNGNDLETKNNQGFNLWDYQLTGKFGNI